MNILLLCSYSVTPTFANSLSSWLLVFFSLHPETSTQGQHTLYYTRVYIAFISSLLIYPWPTCTKVLFKLDSFLYHYRALRPQKLVIMTGISLYFPEPSVTSATCTPEAIALVL